MAYFDAAAERIQAHESRRFDSMVDAVRVGYITARDPKAYRKWQSRRRGTDAPVGLSGAGLEQAIRALAHAHPEYVVVGR